MPDVLLIAIAAIVALAVGVVLALLFATSSSTVSYTHLTLPTTPYV